MSDSLSSPAAAGEEPLAEKLERLVPEWLTVPDVADMWGVEVLEVHRALEEHALLGIKRGKPKVLCVPALLADPEPLEKLAGTVLLLIDAGFSQEEVLVWLFTPDESLPGTPAEQLRLGRRGEVRRRAQALAW